MKTPGPKNKRRIKRKYSSRRQPIYKLTRTVKTTNWSLKENLIIQKKMRKKGKKQEKQEKGEKMKILRT